VFLIALDLCFEPFVERSKSITKLVIWIMFAAMIVGFSYAVVFVKSPLQVSAFITDAEYPVGETIAGIAWRPEFSELQVWLSNPSRSGYDDLNIVVRPSSAVAKIGQATNVPDVSFEDKNGLTTRLTTITPSDQRTGLPLDLLATDAGYRVRCPHLPAHTEIKLVLAFVDMKWPVPAYVNQLPPQQKFQDSNYVVRVKFDDFSTYWQGHPNTDMYAPRPRFAERIKVEGEYVGGQRIRSISQWVGVEGTMGSFVATPQK
jgi:hypothetical protein